MTIADCPDSICYMLFAICKRWKPTAHEGLSRQLTPSKKI